MNKLFIVLFLLITVSGCQTRNEKKERPNILFIGIDDLRPELGCYGSDIAVSPNLDKLAGQGLLFKRAYCQEAICGPSRASLMTGIRPETSGIIHNYIKFREKVPTEATLSQHFGANGYNTAYLGKIFHHGDDDDASWNWKPVTDSLDQAKRKKIKGFALSENIERTQKKRTEMFAKYGEVAKYGLAMGPAYECADVPDNAYIDGYNTDIAIKTMQEMLKKSDKPFFLGLGFNKPHLNWIAPKKYWDLYDRERIPLANQQCGPEGGSAMGLHPSFELRTRDFIPNKGDIDPELAKTLKHAYLACVSYVDAQIGRMIHALEEAGVRDNTIIIIWSDHGWHLGDMGIWGKATNYEISNRVPLLIWTPDMPKGSRGKSTDALVELVDMYPSLCDLAGIGIPEHVEGTSFKALIENPDRNWKTASFSQFPTPALREWGGFPLRPAMRETYFGPLIEEMENKIEVEQKGNWNKEEFENNVMGYSMRTKSYRFIVWKNNKFPDRKPLAIELYDLKENTSERVNIADKNPELVEQLMQQFNAGWKGSSVGI
ncbi:iduronate-2-sulfatase [Labilibaculum filiforme]|uniref:Iduronate-2-sulfatase n=1 Tax=Labilibaculum filiforme TaxID=1940526 RepID=A0A2N3HSK4_9BACT|nr:sulfatase [Labilibaculum filiforme]PKQ61032.1 iduronate-2-sulfatase [Labilibaculum filiforme]